MCRRWQVTEAWSSVTNSTPAQGDRYLYTAAESDSVLGLRQHRARFTNGAFWLSEDPKGFAAGDANLYRYVGNQPTNATDPSGLQKGVRGNASALLEGGAWGLIPGESRNSLLQANGHWKKEAQEFAETMKLRHPQLTFEQRRGVNNAARHLYWMMLLTARYGEGTAKTCGDLHERGENSLDSLADQFHNILARERAPKVHAKLLEQVAPLLKEYEWMDKVPGNTTYVTVKGNLLDAAWASVEKETKKEIKAYVQKLIDESAKDPLKGPLIIDLDNDPRVNKLPGWKAELPKETEGSNPSK